MNASGSRTTLTTRSIYILATLRERCGTLRILPGISSAATNADAGTALPATSAIGKQQTSARERCGLENDHPAGSATPTSRFGCRTT